MFPPGVEGGVKLRPMEQPSHVVEAIKPKKGRDVSSSEFHSEGYETITTSDLMSEVYNFSCNTQISQIT